MPGPTQCCLLGVCCPPSQQIEVLAEVMMAKGMTKATAMKAAKAVAGRIRKAHKAAMLKASK